MINDFQSLEDLIQKDFESIFNKVLDSCPRLTGCGVKKELHGQALENSLELDKKIENYFKSIEVKK